MQKLMRCQEVIKTVGLSRASIYRLMEEGLFPRPVRIGKAAIAWKQEDLQQWIDSRTSTAA